MAGEIQDPVSLSFQTNSINSGSISFGRFEKEGLCWERRSSFSHNRYLEEVDKCSKPGSVTEMKAHFEAHFKKKGIRFPTSLESQTWGVHKTSEQGDAATESFEDYDEILVNSDDVIELDEEGGGEHRTLACPSDNVEVSYEDLGPHEIPLEIEVGDGNEDKRDCVTVEETESKLDQHVPDKLSDDMERPSSSASRSNSHKNLKPMRHDVMPKAASMKTKSSLSSNSKTNIDAKSSQKEPRPKTTVKSQPPTSKKTDTRTHLATNRFNTKLEKSTNDSGFRFKCSERAENRKEFYMKLQAKKTGTNQVQAKSQEKTEAEMKQFRKSLNFKATPMPSFYNTGTSPRSRDKTEPSKFGPSRPRNTTSASVTNREVTKTGIEEGEREKVMVRNRKQSAAKDSDLLKGRNKT